MMFDGAASDILDSILTEAPAGAPAAYMTSALRDVRRAMSRHNRRVTKHLLEGVATLPDWLQGEEVLPPWEARLLRDLFSKKPVVVVYGGSGCGKTSSLIYVQRYCRQLPIASNLPTGNPLLRIDFDDQGEEHRKTRVRRADQIAQQEAFLAEFARKAHVILEPLADDIFIRCFRRAFLDRSPKVDVVTTTAEVCIDVRAAAHEKMLGENISREIALDALQTTSNAHEAVIARLMMIRELARYCGELVQGARLVLAVDNIDPYPEYLQAALVRTLEAVSHGVMTVQPEHDKAPLTVALFARLSTTTRHYGVLGHVRAKRIPFQSIDPAELIFYRLTAALLDPSRVEDMSELDVDERARFLRSLHALWERLITPEGDFGESLGALAGTNCRIASIVSRAWVQSTRLASEPLPAPLDGDALRQALAVAVLLRGAIAVRDVVRRARAGSRQMEETAADVAAAWARVLVGDTASVMSLPERDLRAIVLRSAREGLGQLLSVLDPDDELLKLCSQHLESCAGGAFREQFPDARREERAQFEAAMASESHRLEELLERLDGGATTVATALRWGTEVLTQGVRTSGRHATYVLPETIWNLVYERLHAGEHASRRPTPSAWKSVSILVRPERELREEDGAGAINLFSVRGQQIRPIGLFTLCRLEEDRQGVHGVVLWNWLRDWGFSQEDLLVGLGKMVHQNRRMIYSGVRDFDDGVAHWATDSSLTVQISSAGTRYLETLVASPAYLQWALLEPLVIRSRLGEDWIRTNERSASGRLRLVLKAFDLVYADETDRAENLDVSARNSYRRSNGPLGWAYFSGLDRFLKDISGIGQPDEEKAGLAAEFMHFGAQVARTHREMFRAVPVEWEAQWAFASQTYAERFPKAEFLDLYPATR